jgi:hypothetical protein
MRETPAPELLRPEEETVRLGADLVMSEVGVADPREVGESREHPRRGQPPVDEAVVHEEVGRTEERHADTDAECDLVGAVRRAAAPVHDEQNGDGRVADREHVVGLEAALPARAVMRAMEAPEHPVPRVAMKQHRPRLHGARGDEGGRYPEGEGAHV